MTTHFHGLELQTAPGDVFTPRATTERLVDAALERIGRDRSRIADVGTGSGAIALAIAAAAPNAEVWATDTNPAAVDLARRNAKRLGLADRIHVLGGDLLEPVPGPVDLVVANLPYLAAHEYDPAYDDEPFEAIYAPGDGLDPLRRMLDLCAGGKLTMPGWVLVQYHRRVLEADCQHLDELRARLETRARLAA